jgi:hypothetical protein
MIPKRLRGKLGMAIFTLFVFAAYAQQQTLTPEMVVSLKIVSSVTIDPTGKKSPTF